MFFTIEVGSEEVFLVRMRCGVSRLVNPMNPESAARSLREGMKEMCFGRAQELTMLVPLAAQVHRNIGRRR